MVTGRRAALGVMVLGLLLILGAFVVLRLGNKSTPPSARVTPIVTPDFPKNDSTTLHDRVVSKDLGIDLAVVEGDGWTVPYNRAAHFPGMKLPGQNGRSLLYAHDLAGMFAPLGHATVGQHVDIQRQGQPTLHYVIKQVFPQWSPGDLTYTKPGDHEELVLLTCTSYNANDPRVIVVAEPV